MLTTVKIFNAYVIERNALSREITCSEAPIGAEGEGYILRALGL